MLAMFVNENQNDWDDHLPYLTSVLEHPFKKVPDVLRTVLC